MRHGITVEDSEGGLRIPAPVYGIMAEVRYQEEHAGVPILMRVFMWSIRLTAFCLLCIPFAILAYTMPMPGLGNPAAIIPLGILFWLFTFPNTKLDIFLPLGFRLFHRLIEQR